MLYNRKITKKYLEDIQHVNGQVVLVYGYLTPKGGDFYFQYQKDQSIKWKMKKNNLHICAILITDQYLVMVVIWFSIKIFNKLALVIRNQILDQLIKLINLSPNQVKRDFIWPVNRILKLKKLKFLKLNFQFDF